VSPVFEELALGISQRLQCLRSISAEARKRRNVVGADEHVDGVDLKRMQPCRHLA